jgi:predicted transcriptional regulator
MISRSCKTEEFFGKGKVQKRAMLEIFQVMIFVMDVDWQESHDFPSNERDLNVLNLIGEEDLTSFTFDGLKRRLGVHSETLSRILCRLEEQGLVEKLNEGYRVMAKVKEFVPSFRMSGASRVPVMQTLLSPDVPVHRVVSDLSGRWFGSLRWLGYSENRERVTLKWITEDGGVQVNAVFSGNQLSVEAKLLREKDLNIALEASYQLIGLIAKLYSGRSRIRHVAYFGGFEPHLMFT